MNETPIARRYIINARVPFYAGDTVKGTFEAGTKILTVKDVPGAGGVDGESVVYVTAVDGRTGWLSPKFLTPVE